MTELLNLKGRSFIVIGDLMIDEYHIGTVTRLSPEAPVPILNFSGSTFAPGGAANVAMNLAKLGNKVELVGAVGDDEAGHRLLELLKTEGIGTDGIICVHGFSTTRKTRFLTQQQVLLRVDYENKNQIRPQHCMQMTYYLRKYFGGNKVDGILISDYDKGLFSSANRTLWETMFADMKRGSIYCGADSKKKGRDLSLFAGFDFLKPNLNELYMAIGKEPGDEYALENACLDYFTLSKAKALFVTMGKDGVYCFDGVRGQKVNAAEAKVKDTTGAGDSVFAVLVFASANGLDCVNAARLSNIAASVIIEKAGTAVISFDELCERVDYLENVKPEYFND